MDPRSSGMPLEGRRILIAETELDCAIEAEMFLEGQGCRVLGPTSSTATALALLDGKRPPDAALLGLVLEGEMPRRLVAALGARRIPFVVVVGDSPGCAAGLPSLERVPWIGKPLTGRKILLALICALNGPH